ncbi:MAG: (2Fe-2S)-binding protein [Zetaproteobacteria bacterium]|nr:(2Fe-2S)-binding protein [Zetaproteobacteria bacterium]
MIVCLCKSLSERKIRQSIAEGACSVREVQHCTKAGTQCGACLEEIQNLIDQSGASGTSKGEFVHTQAPRSLDENDD